METAIVQQFLDFFQDFIILCQTENWPDNNTNDYEIKNAFLVAQHVEKCLDKLQNRSIIDEFLTSLSDAQNKHSALVKTCFSNPTKYILKKIINSKCKINVMDTGFKIFLELFTEDKLETYLTEIMVESASTETLLKMCAEIPKDKLLELKSLILLSELEMCEEPTEILLEMLQSGKGDNIEVLLVSLLNKDTTYLRSVNNIANSFIKFMKKRESSCKSFWKSLFHVKDELFLQVCVAYNDLFNIICGALLDIGKLLKENMCTDYFYINLTYSELRTIVQKISINNDLKIDFTNVVRERNSELTFWDNIMS